VILKLLTLANIPLRSGFFEGLVAMGVPEKLSSLTWALFYSLVICFMPVYFLYKKKVFIKL
jgi:hypothetical protein